MLDCIATAYAATYIGQMTAIATEKFRLFPALEVCLSRLENESAKCIYICVHLKWLQLRCVFASTFLQMNG